MGGTRLGWAVEARLPLMAFGVELPSVIEHSCFQRRSPESHGLKRRLYQELRAKDLHGAEHPQELCAPETRTHAEAMPEFVSVRCPVPDQAAIPSPTPRRLKKCGVEWVDRTRSLPQMHLKAQGVVKQDVERVLDEPARAIKEPVVLKMKDPEQILKSQCPGIFAKQSY